MEIAFKTRKLEKCFLSHKEAERSFGAQVARKFIQRVNIIQAAATVDELRAMRSLDCHQLKGDRQGQWAVKLTGRYRLLFSIEAGSSENILMLEVSNHYGD